MADYIDGYSATTGPVRIALDDPPDSLYKIFKDLRGATPKKIGPISLKCDLLSDETLKRYATRIEIVFENIVARAIARQTDALTRSRR